MYGESSYAYFYFIWMRLHKDPCHYIDSEFSDSESNKEYHRIMHSIYSCFKEYMNPFNYDVC